MCHCFKHGLTKDYTFILPPNSVYNCYGQCKILLATKNEKPTKAIKKKKLFFTYMTNINIVQQKQQKTVIFIGCYIKQLNLRITYTGLMKSQSI